MSFFLQEEDQTLPSTHPSSEQDSPFVDDNLPEDDGVLHQREEDEEHAGEEPDLQGRHRVGDRDPRGGGVEHVY